MQTRRSLSHILARPFFEGYNIGTHKIDSLGNWAYDRSSKYHQSQAPCLQCDKAISDARRLLEPQDNL